MNKNEDTVIFERYVKHLKEDAQPNFERGPNYQGEWTDDQQHQIQIKDPELYKAVALFRSKNESGALIQLMASKTPEEISTIIDQVMKEVDQKQVNDLLLNFGKMYPKELAAMYEVRKQRTRTM